ncbi:MAG: DEAD/DEAH box helicase [Verrucomicrobiaceae bacterium]|nr:DEAD/DEAH box helicase [Verrucomicrobiaceae bacterium]
MPASSDPSAQPSGSPLPPFAVGEDFRSVFKSLSRLEVEVMLWLGAQREPQALTRIADGLKQSGIRRTPTNLYSSTEVKTALQSLQKRGLVEMAARGGWSVHWHPANFVAAFAARVPEYLPTLEAVYAHAYFPKQVSASFYYRNPFFRNDDQGKLRAFYYLGRLDEMLAQYEEIEKYHDSPPSLLFLTEPLDRERFERLPLAIRRDAVASTFAENWNDLRSPLELIAYVTEETNPLFVDAATVRALAETGFLMGRTAFSADLAELLLTDESTRDIPEAIAEAYAIRAGSDFLRGHYDEAIAGYEESLAIRKKGSRKRKMTPPGLGALFYQIALARRGRPEDFSTALQTGKWGAELLESEFARLLSYGCSIVDCVSGKGEEVRRTATKQNKRFRTEKTDPFSAILFVMLARLSGVSDDILKPWVPLLEYFATLSLKGAYNGFALEFIALRNAIASKESKEIDAIVAEINRDSELEEYVPFSTSLNPNPAWENGLIALEQLAAKHSGDGKTGSAKGPSSRKEIVWNFQCRDQDDLDAGYWSLIPIERTVSAKGRISKGRRIALKRLKESPEAFPHLTDYDRAISGHIQHTRGSYYERESYYFDTERLLLDLSGHPLLFADESATRPLVFRRGRFRLETRELANGHLEVRLEPGIVTHRAVHALRESSSSYVVYEATPAIRGLAGILGENATMTIPGEAKERFFQAVSTFAADVDIAADGDFFATVAASDPGLRQVESDATVRLRLLPEGEGLAVRMFVRPIEGGDAIFAPGEGKQIVFGVVSGERLQTRRPLDSERTAAEAILGECPTLRESRGELSDLWEWRFPNANDCLALLRDLHPLREKGIVLEWPKEEPFRLSGVASTSNTKLSLGSAGDWLTASGEVRINEDLVLTMRQLLDLVAEMPRGSEFVELGDGQFLALESDFRHYLEDMRALAQPGKGETMKLPPLAALALEEFVEKTGTSLRSKTWREWIERFRLAKDHDPEVPAALQAELRPYQIEGYRWLSRLAKSGAGACLADDMGLGKTVQALALLLERAPDGPALVVAPTSVAANWFEETLKFAPTLRASIFGSGDRQVQLAAAGPHDLIICTYGLLQREEEALAAIPWHTVILDEAQAIKNSATGRSKAARKLQADFRLVTTGTPVENRLSELHTLFRFLLPGYLGSWDHFRKNFADPIERDRDPVARDRLRRLIHPFLLRRLKSGVLRDLPPRTEIHLSIELSEPESAFYEALRSRAVEQLTNTGSAAPNANEDPGKKAFQILAELTRLRRACCHPALVDPKVGKTIRSAKLAAFTETVEEILAGRHQVLVFSQFVDHLALIRAELDEKGIVYQYLDGSTPTKKRKEAVDAFQRGEGNVFLISLKAGGFGLNLTAADYVIHMDPWWNPATEDQASDRAHRIGQTRPVTIYRFITKGTIEEKIVSLHHQKRELAESLLSGSDDANVRLSPEELLDLIRE